MYEINVSIYLLQALDHCRRRAGFAGREGPSFRYFEPFLIMRFFEKYDDS